MKLYPRTNAPGTQSSNAHFHSTDDNFALLERIPRYWYRVITLEPVLSSGGNTMEMETNFMAPPTFDIGGALQSDGLNGPIFLREQYLGIQSSLDHTLLHWMNKGNRSNLNQIENTYNNEMSIVPECPSNDRWGYSEWRYAIIKENVRSVTSDDG